MAQTPSVHLPTALLSIGFTEATLADFVSTASYPKRLADPMGFLAVSADFRGDGRTDDARLLRNVERGVAYVVVVCVRDKVDTYIVKSVSLSDADNLGVRAAESLPGRRASGLTIFALDGSLIETFDLVDDDFAERQRE